VRFTTEDLTLPTRYTYTGQYSYISDSATDLTASASFGLMFYNARWYDPALGRFAQADTVVPGGVQGLDRYAYTNNSPVNYVDPSGHDVQCTDEGCYETSDAGSKVAWLNPTEPMKQGEGGFGWDSQEHPGVDINADNFNSGSTEVVASTYGTVITSTACTIDPCTGDSVYTSDGYGNVVIIAYEWDSLPPEVQAKILKAYPWVKEGATIYMLYAHLEAPSGLQEGDSVAPGQFIGNIGNTGDSYGAHLHLEIRVENDGTNFPMGDFYQDDKYTQLYTLWHGDGNTRYMIPLSPHVFFTIY
jgi:RHS repeat-associated protein